MVIVIDRINYYKGLERDHWWDELELVYDYDIEGLQQAVLDMKDKKSNRLILSAESYDFVLFLGQYV
jgi:hypothetical protein